MKKHLLFSALMIFGLFITACASATPTATEMPADHEMPTETSAPAPTADTSSNPAPTETTSSAPVPASGGAVNITLADNTISTSQTTFQAGLTYTFVITNNGHRPHDFNINTPVSIAGSINGAADTALLAIDREQLTPGATITVEFTFPASAVGQPLEFSCLITRHYNDGMLEAITVTE